MKKKWHKFVELWNQKHPNNKSEFSSYDNVIKNRTHEKRTTHNGELDDSQRENG